MSKDLKFDVHHPSIIVVLTAETANDVARDSGAARNLAEMRTSEYSRLFRIRSGLQ